MNLKLTKKEESKITKEGKSLNQIKKNKTIYVPYVLRRNTRLQTHIERNLENIPQIIILLNQYNRPFSYCTWTWNVMYQAHSIIFKNKQALISSRFSNTSRTERKSENNWSGGTQDCMRVWLLLLPLIQYKNLRAQDCKSNISINKVTLSSGAAAELDSHTCACTCKYISVLKRISIKKIHRKCKGGLKKEHRNLKIA